MTIEAAFLQAILEAPGDDGLRLIYADWLEERGDPRGEFIRVQMELAGLSECFVSTVDDGNGDVGGYPCRCRWHTLRRREQELLTTDNRAKWTQPYPAEYYFTIEAFRRGFVEHISCTDNGWLKYNSLILQQQPVQEVTLTMLSYTTWRWGDWNETAHMTATLANLWPQIKKWNLS